METHENHRERLKARFAEQGLDGFTDFQALELLLFYAIPRKDTNPIAHSLIDTFGSLSRVMEADVEELKKIAGIGENAAVFLRLMSEFQRFCKVNRAEEIKILSDLDACAQYLLPRFHGRTVETVFLLCLDAKCKVLCCKEVGRGSINSTGVSIRKIVEVAMVSKATSVVLAHNHPSGFAIPSVEDIATTRKIAMALQAVDVTMADHIIVAEDDYVSLAASGERFNDFLLI